MKERWTLKGEGERLLELRGGLEPGRASAARPAVTVQEVCRLLKKSRRQVYRYVKAGRLKPRARILGQWLFSREEVDRFRNHPAPSFLKPLFWDVRLSDLSVDHHRDFILGRLLEWGDRQALQWLFRTYSREAILNFLRRRGTALLSRRSWHFWTLQFGRKPPRRQRGSWRLQGRRWGGVG